MGKNVYKIEKTKMLIYYLGTLGKIIGHLGKWWTILLEVGVVIVKMLTKGWV